MFAFVFGLQQGHEWGWSSPVTLGFLASGLVLLEIFSFIQIKSDDPLIQLRLFRNPAFAIDCALLFCIQFAMISLIVFGAIFLQKNLGFTPLQAGLGIMPIILSVVVMSQVSGRLFDRVGVKVPALTGAFLIAAGFFLQAPFLEGGDFLKILPGMILLGFGIGFVMVPTSTDALNRAGSEYRGQASGVVQTMRQIGATVGLASIGGLVATVQKGEVSKIISGFGGPDSVRAGLEPLIDGSLKGQIDAIRELTAISPALMPELHTAVARSIAAGYYFAGSVVLAAFFVALIFMKRGTQYEDG
jgi:predicted MFS family arabinose efflux permease